MSCEAWREAIIDRLAGELSEEQAIQLEQHLAECPECTVEARRLAEVLASALPCAEWVADPRIEARLVGEMRRQRASARAGSVRHGWRSLLAPRVPTYATLGVALLCVVIGIQVGQRHRGDGADRQTERAPGVSPGNARRALIHPGDARGSLPLADGFATTPLDAIPAAPASTPDSL